MTEPRTNASTSARLGPGRGPLAMAEFDRLPPELRRWLAEAALPWEVRSARRAWRRALLLSCGSRARALARLEARQARRLAEDARTVWGRPPG